MQRPRGTSEITRGPVLYWKIRSSSILPRGYMARDLKTLIRKDGTSRLPLTELFWGGDERL